MPRLAETKPPVFEAAADKRVVSAWAWDDFDLNLLAAEVRATTPAPDAEKTIWAFEKALRVARVDDGLLEYLLVATVCLLAQSEGSTPRTVLETFFCRSVSDEEWRSRYARLFE
jgi:hypothetical protein